MREPGLRPAQLALVAGLAYAAISVYWGSGGRWLVDTVGGTLARGHGAVNAAALAAWVAAVRKVIAPDGRQEAVPFFVPAACPIGSWWLPFAEPRRTRPVPR